MSVGARHALPLREKRSHFGETNPRVAMIGGQDGILAERTRGRHVGRGEHASPLREKRGHLDQTNPTEEPIISMSVPMRVEAGR
jgi:hypothetical protein